MTDDANDIMRQLEDRLEDICSEYWNGWLEVQERGVRIGLMTPRLKGKNKRPTSSFRVELSGTNRGRWFRFSDPDNSGGGAIGLLFYGAYGRKLQKGAKADWAEAFKLSKEFLGISERRQISPEEQRERDARRKADDDRREAERRRAEAQAAKRKTKKTLTAKEIISECRPIIGTAAERYLCNRGLPPVKEWPWQPKGCLGFHPGLEHELSSVWENDKKVQSGPLFPCLVGVVRDPFDDVVACWRIYLTDAGEKAPVDMAKVGLGPAGGGAVRIGGDGPSIGVAEGMETALAAWFLEGCRKPIWACLSTSGLVGFEPPGFVERIEIFPDGDRAKENDRGVISARPGIRAANTLRDRMLPILGQGNVSVAQEPTAGSDYLDVYCRAKDKGLL